MEILWSYLRVWTSSTRGLLGLRCRGRDGCVVGRGGLSARHPWLQSTELLSRHSGNIITNRKFTNRLIGTYSLNPILNPSIIGGLKEYLFISLLKTAQSLVEERSFCTHTNLIITSYLRQYLAVAQLCWQTFYWSYVLVEVMLQSPKTEKNWKNLSCSK